MKTKELNTYKVTSVHDVYVVSYENEEENHVNSYILSSEIKAANWKDAIKKYFEECLFFGIDLNHGYVDVDSNTFHYSNLVDVDDIEVSDREIEQWKENKLTLYSNNTVISVAQIINTILK